jgi:hypothetical protein
VEEQEPFIITRLLDAGSDPSDQTVSLSLGLDDGRATVIHFSLAVIGAVMGAMAAEANKLNSQIPEKDRRHVPLNAEAVWLSSDADGRPMIVFEMQGGTLLPLAMQMGDFSGLAAEMSLLAAKPDESAH